MKWLYVQTQTKSGFVPKTANVYFSFCIFLLLKL